MDATKDSEQEVLLYGGDILLSTRMQLEKQCYQHGHVTVFAHSVGVACLCVYLARRLHLRVHERAMVRGALLHDYFLYDWHVPDRSHRLHGFTHARRALENAGQDFALDDIERDIIARHMFPLNLRPPKYWESALVCLADKICAACETLSFQDAISRLTCGKPRHW